MENKRIIYPTPDGKVAIVVPVINCGLTLEQIIEKAIPINTPYKIVNVSDIPTDRTFRDAWEYMP